jgi:hypothetical protein
MLLQGFKGLYGRRGTKPGKYIVPSFGLSTKISTFPGLSGLQDPDGAGAFAGKARPLAVRPPPLNPMKPQETSRKLMKPQENSGILMKAHESS